MIESETALSEKAIAAQVLAHRRSLENLLCSVKFQYYRLYQLARGLAVDA
jgi:hypothetical protein